MIGTDSRHDATRGRSKMACRRRWISSDGQRPARGRAVDCRIGRTVGLGDLALDEDGYCALLIDKDSVVNIELDEIGQQVLLYSLIGQPAGDPRATFEQLLRANYLGRGTGGAAFGLQPEGGIVLSQWLAVPGLDLARLNAILERFVNQVEAWTQRLPQLGEQAEAPISVEFPLIRG